MAKVDCIGLVAHAFYAHNSNSNSKVECFSPITTFNDGSEERTDGKIEREREKKKKKLAPRISALASVGAAP